MLIDCTTAQASILAGSYAGVLQHIEGNVLRSFKGKKMVLSFWVKATKTGTYCVALRNGTSTKAYIMEYSVSATNTWEKKTLRFTHDTTGTWSYDNTIGLTVVWTIAAGSTFQTTANTWANGNFLATVNQVNACDAITNDFQLTDVCLQEDNDGQTRVPDFQLAGRDVFDELRLCQRYYEIFQIIDVRGYAVSSDSVIAPLGFKTTKRAIPIATANTSFPSNSSGGSITNVTTTGCNLRTIAAVTGGSSISFTPTFDSEL
jgi:hypothetical protein